MVTETLIWSAYSNTLAKLFFLFYFFFFSEIKLYSNSMRDFICAFAQSVVLCSEAIFWMGFGTQLWKEDSLPSAALVYFIFPGKNKTDNFSQKSYPSSNSSWSIQILIHDLSKYCVWGARDSEWDMASDFLCQTFFLFFFFLNWIADYFLLLYST